MTVIRNGETNIFGKPRKFAGYKLRFRAHRPSLYRYERMPPKMVGEEDGYWRNWDHRCRALYEIAIAEKRGVIPASQRKGLWWWLHATIA